MERTPPLLQLAFPSRWKAKQTPLPSHGRTPARLQFYSILTIAFPSFFYFLLFYLFHFPLLYFSIHFIPSTLISFTFYSIITLAPIFIIISLPLSASFWRFCFLFSLRTPLFFLFLFRLLCLPDPVLLILSLFLSPLFICIPFPFNYFRLHLPNSLLLSFIYRWD